MFIMIKINIKEYDLLMFIMIKFDNIIIHFNIKSIKGIF